MDKGVIWKTEGRYIQHAISWHELNVSRIGNLRIWIHSRGNQQLREFVDNSGERVDGRTLFTIASVDIQLQGKKFLPVNNVEMKARIEVAQQAPESDSQSLSASFFRDLPFAKLQNDHMKCLSACQAKAISGFGKPLKLASSNIVPSLIFKNGKIDSIYETTMSKKIEIASTKADSIVIAKIYSEMSKIGNSKIVMQICADFNIEKEIVYSALRVARSQGWLSANGKGKSGGTITAKGEKEFINSNGVSTLNKWLAIQKKAGI